MKMTSHDIQEHAVRIGPMKLEGDLRLPSHALGIVVFAHGSGSSRHSSRNRFVAQALNDGGMATLLMDLLTREEEQVDEHTRHLRFDIRMLADRLLLATEWLARDRELSRLPIGFFGASTGGGAALVAAADEPRTVKAVVSRGGRPDLAGPALAHVACPTLLIVGGHDEPVIGMNVDAMRQMTAPVHMEVVPGATHLFEEPGALERVADLAVRWFERHLPGEA
jgi:putative phosphoribosyl transferase